MVTVNTNVEIIEAKEANRGEWNEYIHSFPDTHFFHDYRWREVLEKSFGHRSFYLAALENKKVVGLLPLVFIKGKIVSSCLVSLPFLNYGGILTGNKWIAETLLEKATEILTSLGGAYIEMRHSSKFDLQLVTREHKVTMLLELSKNVDEQWTRLGTKVRNHIRKAEKSGLLTSRGKEELLGDFYRVFCRNMRDLGTPVLSGIFFKNILQGFPKESQIFIVKYRDRPIAGALTLTCNDRMEIPWASSIQSYNRLCPNTLLYWEAIKNAIAMGCREFDFGRCTKDSTTYRFKEQWGTRIKQLYWQYRVSKESALPTMAPSHSQFAPAIWFWKRLPLALANRLGPLIAKNIPIF
jgi:FemAB-related protein (PEP-CTERM system-associated)